VKRDRLIGIIVTIIGLLIFFLSTQIQGNQYSTVIGPDLFPKMASGGMTLCGIGLILRKSKEEESFLTIEGWIRIIKILVVLIIYPFLLVYFGFIISGIFLVFFSSTLFDIKKSASILKRLIFAVSTSVITFAFFSYVLDIILPNGKVIKLLLG